MGYGIALSGVKEWIAHGNVVMPNTRFAGNMERCLGNAAPTPFLKQWADRQRTIDCQIQPDFVNGEASWLIGVEPGTGPTLWYEGGQLWLNSKGESKSGKGGIALKGAKWEVSSRGEFQLRESNDHFSDQVGHGKVIWSSGGGKHDVKDPALNFLEDGTLSVRSHNGTGSVIWDPTSYLKPHLEKLAASVPLKENGEGENDPSKWASHSRLSLSNKSPFLELRSNEGHLVYATAYEYSPEWSIHSGQWIAIAPASLRGFQPEQSTAEPQQSGGPPPIPPRQHHFSSFVKDLSTGIQQFDTSNPGAFLSNFTSSRAPPPIPPRPDTCPAPSPASEKPVFLFLNPDTHQLTLHSSSSPAHPEPEHIHWIQPAEPVAPGASGSWFTMQYDCNAVLYVKRGEEVHVPFATNTGGAKGLKLALRGHGEGGGPAMELIEESGKVAWSSRR